MLLGEKCAKRQLRIGECSAFSTRVTKSAAQSPAKTTRGTQGTTCRTEAVRDGAPGVLEGAGRLGLGGVHAREDDPVTRDGGSRTARSRGCRPAEVLACAQPARGSAPPHARQSVAPRRARSSSRPRPPATPRHPRARRVPRPVVAVRCRREAAGRGDERRVASVAARSRRPLPPRRAGRRRRSRRRGATQPRAEVVPTRRDGVADASAAREAVLLTRRERLAAAADSSSSDRVRARGPRLYGATERASAVAQNLAPSRIGAPQMHTAPPPPRRTSALPSSRASISLHPRLDCHELRAALDDQTCVEAVALVHLEREPAEVAQPLLAHLEQRLPLALELARRRRDVRRRVAERVWRWVRHACVQPRAGARRGAPPSSRGRRRPGLRACCRSP